MKKRTKKQKEAVKQIREQAKFFTRHLWITGTGTMLGLGIFIKCVLKPLINEISPADPQGMIYSLAILLIATCSRDILIERARQIKRLEIKTPEDEFFDDKLPPKKAAKRWWIPFVGWAIAGGYAINCVVCPFATDIQPVDWTFLEIVLLLMLVITGGKDIFFSGLRMTFAIGKFANKTGSTEDSASEE